MSAAKKGIKFSPETRAKMRAAKKGRKGRKMSPEFCAKISAALKGIKKTPETIAKRQATRAANRALKPVQYSSECYHQSQVQLS